MWLDRIRVLLAEMPQLLRDVIRYLLSDQPDMEVIGNISDWLELLVTAREMHADVVILGVESSELPGICSHLLHELPDIKLLGVTDDTRHAFLHELRPQKVPLREASAQGLLDAIRAAVRA